MPALDHHMLDLIYRVTHLVGMAVLTGGAVLIAAAALGEPAGDSVVESTGDPDLHAGPAPTAGHPAHLCQSAARYEHLFWAVLMIQILTGIGSLGLFGGSVPAPESPWGGHFALKLSLVLVLAVLSVLRASVIAGLLGATGSQLPARARNLIFGAYGGTAIVLVSIVVFAVRLTRG